jgi:hypothetical protein
LLVEALCYKVTGSIPKEISYFNLPNSSSSTMAPEYTQPLTETSSRNLPEGKERPGRKADNKPHVPHGMLRTARDKLPSSFCNAVTRRCQDYGLLGYDAVQSRDRTTFGRNIYLLYSMSNCKQSEIPAEAEVKRMISCSAYSSTLKMEKLCSFETSHSRRNAWRWNPKGCTPLSVKTSDPAY